MARSDWESFGATDSNHQFDDSKSTQGTASLRVLDGNTFSAEILEQSLVDKPGQGAVGTKLRTNSSYDGPNVFFRFVDDENYYSTYYESDTLYLYRMRDANRSHVDSVVHDIGNNYFDNSFAEAKVRFWLDERDDLRVRWLIPNGDAWEPMGDDLIHETPLFAEGGGIGVGGGYTHNDLWYDETKVYYPE